MWLAPNPVREGGGWYALQGRVVPFRSLANPPGPANLESARATAPFSAALRGRAETVSSRVREPPWKKAGRQPLLSVSLDS